MNPEWPIDRTLLPALPELSDPPTDEEQAAYDVALAQRNHAEDMAVFVLWALSARQFGVWTTIARPCPPRGFPRSTYIVAWDAVSTVSTCGCLGYCGRNGPSVVHLPGPVAPPTDDDPIVVSIADELLDASEFVLEGDVLYRRGGIAWPGQNLARPLGEPGTWSVTYRRGIPAPDFTAPLAGQLAKEILAAITGATCRLPSNVVATTRRGVSKTFDPSKIVTGGRTGIKEIDHWIAAVNPHRLQEAPSVL